MWIMTVLKASLSSYRLVNTRKSMSVVCIERRIPASANLMTISHSYWEISPVKLYTYVLITIYIYIALRRAS